MSGTAPSGRPQEAATPLALADELVKMAHNRNGASRLANGSRSYERAYQLEGEAIGLDAAAELVRERLAPAWDALAAELAAVTRDRDDVVTLLDGCQRELGLAVDRKRQAEAHRDRYRAALGRIRDHEAPLIAGVARGIAREALAGDGA